MKKYILCACFASLFYMQGFAQSLDPEAEGVIILLTQVCLNMYASGDETIDPWLSSSGIRQLSKTDAEQYSYSNESRTYEIESVSTFVLSLEDDNLCSIYANDISREALFSTWDSIRSGFAANPNVTENISTSNQEHSTTHYSYSDSAGNEIIRVSISSSDTESQRADFVLSVISAMREINK